MYDEYDKMMSNMNSRDKEALYTTKEEGDLTAAPSSSRQWSSSGLKNPRIVRVSRTFGGKDRHSKVCTIKGLRDRRIRLSVPTAIQLYDLQDRLNLGQPSKVIDWLLDITKHDIDKLPPLPAIPGTFAHFQQDTHHPSYGTSSSNPFIDASLFQSARKESSFNIHRDQSMVDVNEDPSIVEKLKYWDVSDATMRSKQKEIDDENHQGNNSQVLAQNFFPIASGSNNNNNNNNNNSSSILPPSTYLSNNSNQAMYNYYHWEPSNLLSLSQLGSHGLMPSQNDQQGHHSSHSSSLPSPLALSSGSQLFMSPSMSSTSSLFPPPHASYVSNLHHQQAENHDIRQFNRFHHPMSNYPFTTSPFYTTTTSTNGMGLKPFPLSMNHHQHDEDDHDKNEDDG